ncbi:MAG: SpoIIE family protein phosphatase [Clostridia bacterium]|nr:SpoIIE family protein phosphatase [Clostridia bacterium]
MPFDTKLSLKADQSKWIVPACFFYMQVLLVAGITLLMVRGFDALTPMNAFSIGADIFCMAVAVMLSFSVVAARKEGGGYIRIFTTLLTLATQAMFLDECCWVVNGIVKLSSWNLAINVFYFANSAVLIFFFWRYITIALNLESNLMRIVNNILSGLMLPNLLACFTNFFYPLYFYIDEAGYYQRTGGTYIISQVYLVIVLIAFIMALFSSHADRRTKLVTTSFVTVPLVNLALTHYVYGISTQYAAMLIAIVLIYCALFADREKHLANTGRELALATRIQADMLPNVFPPFPDRKDFDIFASMKPAKEVGGDFYDFFLLDDDHLGIVMADVSGKGVPAALFMMVSKILVQNYTLMKRDPKLALEETNNQICSNNREEMFVTVWLGILNLKTGLLTAANAGHEYPVMKKQKNGDFELIKDKHGFVVGGMAGARYKSYELQMEKGSKLFLYTDGVAEATNANKELFGTVRMLDALQSVKDGTPQEVIAAVDKAITHFVGEAPQFDDITMLCLHFKGPQENETPAEPSGESEPLTGPSDTAG